MEDHKIEKMNKDEVYEATCVRCGSKKRINFWPHRTADGKLVGFVFACSDCKDYLEECRLVFYFKGEQVIEYPETHQKGIMSIENLGDTISHMLNKEVDFGFQVARDGRVWVCVDGVAFIRFKPGPGMGE